MFPLPVLDLTDEQLRRINDAFSLLFSGKTNNTGLGVLSGATTTVITHPLITTDSVIIISPETLGFPAFGIQPGDGQAVLTHANSAEPFRYIIVG